MNQCDEIERKWLVEEKYIPTYLKLKYSAYIHQSYISVDPEIRIKMCAYPIDTLRRHHYNMTVKGKSEDGGLVRPEVNLPRISRKDYLTILKATGLDKFEPIKKDYYRYEYNGYDIEISTVDRGKSTSFMYIEIEYETKEEALAFVAPEWFGREVTNDPKYKMKNYWKETRLSK